MWKLRCGVSSVRESKDRTRPTVPKGWLVDGTRDHSPLTWGLNTTSLELQVDAHPMTETFRASAYYT